MDIRWYRWRRQDDDSTVGVAKVRGLCRSALNPVLGHKGQDKEAFRSINQSMQGPHNKHRQAIRDASMAMRWEAAVEVASNGKII